MHAPAARRERTLYIALVTACAAIACGKSGSPRSPSDDVGRDAEAATDGAADAARPIASDAPEFCSHDGADQVRDVFCTSELPKISSLRDLQVLLEFRPAEDPPEPTPGVGSSDSAYQLSQVAVLSHSTALSGHLVSTINPRVIMMGNTTFMAFQRGEQRVELISRARDQGYLNFYLLSFAQACNDAAQGCMPGDLYTPRIESDWQHVRIREGEELKNTPTDCRTCHQRANDVPRLLMRELESPWTHFFFPAGLMSTLPGATGSDLMEDYLLAKSDEPYSGFALHTISAITPFFLQTLAGDQQPLLFDAPAIENERYPYGPDGYATDPHASPTWNSAYEAFKRGEQLALPYFDERATDPDKLAALSEVYQRYRANEIGAEELPELSDIFPDDPHQRALRGLQTEPDATPQDALIQACGSCHNDVLDQSISRALFNISVSRLDRAELDKAIERIQLPYGAEGAMPPREVRQLDPSARERLLEYLKQDANALDPDARLETAARIGMTGGAGENNTGIGAL